MEKTGGIDKKTGLFKFERNGKLFFTNNHDQFNSCYKSIFLDKIYKVEFSKTNPFIIDCGSNIGLAIMFWKENFPDSQILGFEPDPEIFTVLKENTKDLEGVELYQLALSNKTSEVEFTSNGKLSGSLNLTKKLPKVIKVKTDRLSRFLVGKEVDLLKIDIEGEEIKVLFEIKEFLKNIKYLFVEYHSFINEKQNLSKILDLLENEGFRYYLDSDLKNPEPFIKSNNSLNQDLQVNIWAKKDA
ncbi:FkbM family methyltransferase [Echinicola salinicaeni]|uniref:FkbM family methyltransferase n=1 Tax=Echinicola salinicaeni TaxID=2762757 RepID=UPI001644CD56|nr:FkbM family methyltransferase [Echinicola salinicaeni]